MGSSRLTNDVLIFKKNNVDEGIFSGTGMNQKVNQKMLSFSSSDAYVETKNSSFGNSDITNNKIDLHGHLEMKDDWTFKDSILVGSKEAGRTDCMINMDGQVLVSYAITYGISGGLNGTPGAYSNVAVSSNSSNGSGLIVDVLIQPDSTIEIQGVAGGDGYNLGDVMTIEGSSVNASSDIVFAVEDYLGGGYPIIFFGENAILDETFGHQSGTHNAGDIFSNGDFYADTYLATSDERYKANIKDMEELPLSELAPVSFSWKDKKKDQSDKYGFIAQDIAKLYPNIVNTNTTQHFSMDYLQIVPIIVKQLKLLQCEMDRVEVILDRYLDAREETEAALKTKCR